MGGLGPRGWNHSGRATTDDALKLDIDSYRRAGALTDGWRGVTRWMRGDQETGAISVRGGRDQLTASFTVQVRGEEARPISETIPIVWGPWGAVGERPAFLCPRCGDRRLHLYLWRGRVACRGCAELTYQSRRERERDRAIRRAQKLRARLGGELSLDAPPPERPKRMWRRTYERQLAALAAAEQRALDGFNDALVKLYTATDGEAFWR